MISAQQVRRIRREYARTGSKSMAAMKAGVNFRTAVKYLETTKMPSDMRNPRHWRTRNDPFAAVWPEVTSWLRLSPELEAKTLFEYLQERQPGDFADGQLRTFQRRIADWRVVEGPNREVFFGQQHRPGEAMQLDFCSGNSLGITIAGEPFEHLLCHVVLPYSNWQFASSCRSESMLAIRRGLQRAVRKLGHVPTWLQTDNSTAATHRPGQDEELPVTEDGRKVRRPFNPEYEDLVNHLGMKPRTIAVARSEQNGDVESLHQNLRSKMEQHLLLRGSRDFESRDAYDGWRERVLDRSNEHRHKKVGEELRVMRPLRARLLPEFLEERTTVQRTSTIRVDRNTYSVPSRLIDQKVVARLYEDRIEVYWKGSRWLVAERLSGRGNAHVDYRHIIHSLVRKPGAFSRYRHREQLFPGLVFRRTYDALCGRLVSYKADREYLRILKLAADTMECEVATALELLLEASDPFDAEDVKGLIGVAPPEVPDMAPLTVELGHYDGLLRSAREVTA